MIESPTDRCFILKDGKVIKNLQELIESLKKADDAIFSYHVNYAKNDFASWIRDVLYLDDLADKLDDVKDKEETIEILEQHMKDSKDLINLIEQEIKDDIEEIKDTEKVEFDALHKEHDELQKTGENISKNIKAKQKDILIRALYLTIGLLLGIIGTILFYYLFT